MNERLITELEERIYRLMHHEFEGKTLVEASQILGMTTIDIIFHLRELQAKAPQLFPILNHKMYLILHMWRKDTPIAVIASTIGMSERQVRYDLEKLRREHIITSPPKTISYDPAMDDEIREKF